MFKTGIARKLGIHVWIDKLIQGRQQRRNRRQLKKKLANDRKLVAERKKNKVFVIGFNKTGTTSIHAAFEEFDFIVGHQRTAENLLDDIIEGNFEPLFEYCQSAEVFQDAPFSFPNTYKYLDKRFPNSKFILTMRDSDEQWYSSITKFHAKLWSNGRVPPKPEDLAQATYLYKGSPLRSMTYIFGRADYDPTTYKNTYNNHNQEVKAYFKDRPDDLLVLNVAAPDSYQKLCAFLGVTPLRESFEWKNKTSDIKV